MNILRGQKADITKNTAIQSIIAELEWSTANAAMEIDGAAFLLDANGRCEKDENFIFYGQPESSNRSVIHKAPVAGRNAIHLSFASIPQDIAKIALTLTIHDGEKNGQTFQSVPSAKLTIKDQSTNSILYTFTFGEELQKETAIVAAEIYRHNGEWKLNAVGSGFNGGLPSLCENFGLDVIKEEPAPAVPPVPEKKEVKPMIITLKKKEKISITKTEKIIATLEWDSKKDLDLYCFYVLKDGTEGKVYYRNLGHGNKPPYITLSGDSMQAGIETITVHNPSKLNYVLFAAYSAISNGIGSFKKMKAKAIVDNQMGQRITSPLFEENKFAYWVAIAKIDLTDLDDMEVSHVETYSKSGVERSPLLYKDGTFEMNVGPEEFK
ncbi:TerD family protein [Planococcus sp. NCCP-2050]|uniref:TerD family protein n=1 Tax=Planococcus sp. NCCP-2050 TaxID=2944679 RepID=UPI00203D810E|nr:TerD family protein [Planococcus sp. NCCP-2050]GKW45647.1 hypothetical protein NCCP2050_13390 [Planococcus sp. NCCP-2050]